MKTLILLLLISLGLFLIGCDNASQEITSMPSDSIFNNKDRDTEPSVHIYITAEGESSMPFPGEAYLYWRSTPNDQWELADHEVWNTNDTPYLYNGFTGCYLMKLKFIAIMLNLTSGIMVTAHFNTDKPMK
jgi:hypothetical protein